MLNFKTHACICKINKVDRENKTAKEGLSPSSRLCLVCITSSYMLFTREGMRPISSPQDPWTA